MKHDAAPSKEDSEKTRLLNRWLRNEKTGPRTLEIHLTYRCNLHCSFCKYEAARQRNEVDLGLELPLARWLKLIDEAAEMGVLEIRLCGGGEPMYHPERIEQLMLRIKEKGMRGYITTNATLLTEQFARRIVDIGWDLVEMSIDAPRAEIHDSLRGMQGAFDRATAALRAMAARKQEMQVNKPHIKISAVVLRQNAELIPEMASFWGQLGVDELLLLSLNPGGLQEKTHRLSAEQKRTLPGLLEKARSAAEKHSLQLTTHMLTVHPAQDSVTQKRIPTKGKQTLKYSPCYEPWTYLQVHFDGRVGPCCNTYMGELAILRDSTLSEAWHHSRHLNDVRDRLLKWKFEGRCRECGTNHFSDADRLRTNLNGGARHG